MKKVTKPRMTKEEKKLKSMLNYFEISTGGERDEAAAPEETKQMLDKMMNNYDANTLSDIIAKIRNNMIDRMRQQEEESDDDDDDNLGSLGKNNSTQRDDEDLSSIDGISYGAQKDANIKKFISWLYDTLRESSHSVKVMTDGNGNTQIFIQRIGSGGNRM
jgi:uncharacterized protein YegL